jgi:hypothetical protein
MNPILFDIAVLLAKAAPDMLKLIVSIVQSTTLSDEEKKAKLEEIRQRLIAADARVQAVTTKEV